MDRTHLAEETDEIDEEVMSRAEKPFEAQRAWYVGVDFYAEDPGHLINTYGSDKAIEMLKDPKNRTPKPE